MCDHELGDDACQTFRKVLSSAIIPLALTDVDIDVSDDAKESGDGGSFPDSTQRPDEIVTVSRAMTTILKQDGDMSLRELLHSERRRSYFKHQQELMQHLVAFIRRFRMSTTSTRPNSVVDITSVALNEFYYFETKVDDMNSSEIHGEHTCQIKAGGLCEHVKTVVSPKILHWIRGLFTNPALTFDGNHPSDNWTKKMADCISTAVVLGMRTEDGCHVIQPSMMLEEDVTNMSTCRQIARDWLRRELSLWAIQSKEALMQQYSQQINVDLCAVRALIQLTQTNYKSSDDTARVVLDIRNSESVLRGALSSPPLVFTRIVAKAGLGEPFDEVLAASESSVDEKTACLLLGIWFQTKAQSVTPHLHHCESYLRSATLSPLFLHPKSILCEHRDEDNNVAEIRSYTGNRLGYSIANSPIDAVLQGPLCVHAAVRYKTVLLLAELNERNGIPFGVVPSGVCRTAANKAEAGTMAAFIQMKTQLLQNLRGTLMLHAVREVNTVGGQFGKVVCSASSALRLFSARQLERLRYPIREMDLLQGPDSAVLGMNSIAARRAAAMILDGVIGLRARCQFPVTPSETESVVQVLDSRLLKKYKGGTLTLKPRDMRSHQEMRRLFHQLGNTASLGVRLKCGLREQSNAVIVIDEFSPILTTLRHIRAEWPGRY